MGSTSMLSTPPLSDGSIKGSMGTLAASTSVSSTGLSFDGPTGALIAALMVSSSVSSTTLSSDGPIRGSLGVLASSLGALADSSSAGVSPLICIAELVLEELRFISDHVTDTLKSELLYCLEHLVELLLRIQSVVVRRDWVIESEDMLFGCNISRFEAAVCQDILPHEHQPQKQYGDDPYCSRSTEG